MSEGLQLILNDDGVFEEYDDTYDLTIHCESKEEREKVLNRLNWQWIPVSERLPEYDEDIIITHKGAMGQPITSVSYFDGDFRTEDGEGYFSDVMAWMPLPEPYKAESEE